MDAPFGVEVQFNARGSGRFFEYARGVGSNSSATEGGERQEDSSFGGKFSPELDFALEARKFIEFSKLRILRPDREFESHPTSETKQRTSFRKRRQRRVTYRRDMGREGSGGRAGGAGPGGRVPARADWKAADLHWPSRGASSRRESMKTH